MNRIGDFRLSASAIDYVGSDLSRPECIIAMPDGTLWISDNRGGVTRRTADGAQTIIGRIGGDPNGLAMDRQGCLHIANIGDGKLYRLQPDGSHEIVLDQFDGKPLGAVNFVYIDALDRLWLTISTVTEPRSDAVRQPRPDGYILRRDGELWRRVADGFHFTNEIRLDRAGRHLYVAETATGTVTRLPLRSDGSLGTREAFGPSPLFQGALIDGITFDAAGNLWVTEISRNALVVIQPDGTAVTVFEDPGGGVLNVPTSLTFGGPDLTIAYIGSLRMTQLARFKAPFPGEPLRHWR